MVSQGEGTMVLQTALPTVVSTETIGGTERENCERPRRGASTRESSKITYGMEKAHSTMQMEMRILECGRKVFATALEAWNLRTDRAIPVSGRRDYPVEMVCWRSPADTRTKL